MKRAVEVENGVSIVPETTVADEVAAGTLCAIELDAPEMWRPLGTITRNSARISPALREFLAMLARFGKLMEMESKRRTTRKSPRTR